MSRLFLYSDERVTADQLLIERRIERFRADAPKNEIEDEEVCAKSFPIEMEEPWLSSN